MLDKTKTYVLLGLVRLSVTHLGRCIEDSFLAKGSSWLLLASLGTRSCL